MPDNNLRVVIVDYGMGNLFSVRRMCEHVGLDAMISANVDEITCADALILPGVGAFGDAMENLSCRGLVPPLIGFIASGRPLMGICLGMQLLFSESEEFGRHRGLGVIPGIVKRFVPVAGAPVKVPQVGWNALRRSGSGWEHSPLAGLSEGEYMYFVHSFYCVPQDQSGCLAMSEYEGATYCSAYMRENVFVVQFHPEKSGSAGISLCRTWAAGLRKEGSLHEC